MYDNIFSISKKNWCNCFLIYFHLYICPLDLQKSVGVVIHRPITRPAFRDIKILLLSGENFYFVVLVFIIDRSGIKSCLLRPPCRESVVKCLSQGYNRLARVKFKPCCVHHSHGPLNSARPRGSSNCNDFAVYTVMALKRGEPCARKVRGATI